MYNFTETHIIIDCDTNNVISLLQQAKEVGMMGDYQGYFITSLDAHTLDWSEFLHHQTNLTFLRMVDPSRAQVQNAIQDWGYNEKRYGRVLDLRPETVRVSTTRRGTDCIGPPFSPGKYDIEEVRSCIGPPSSDSPGRYDEKRYGRVLDLRPVTFQTEAALMYDAVQVFAKALHEVDLAENVMVPSLSCDSEEPWDYGPTIIDYMKQASHEDGFSPTILEFPGMTGMVRFDEEGRRTDLTLHVVEVYRDGVTKTAVWDSINGLSLVWSYNDTLAEVQRNVQDKIFIVASIIGEPYLTYTKPLGEYTGNDRFEGYSKDLIEAIADNLKFKGYQLILARDGKNGVSLFHLSTMLFVGVPCSVPCVERLFHLGSRIDVRISILFSQLPKEPPNVFSFLKPFSFDVWLFMATAYLGVSIILFVLCRMTPYEWDNPHPCDPDPEELENSFNMLNCLWFSIGSLMAAGCDILPKMSPFEWKTTQPNKGQPQVLENNQTFHNCVWHNMGSLMQQGSDIAPHGRAGLTLTPSGRAGLTMTPSGQSGLTMPLSHRSGHTMAPGAV
uniref:(California timema) hypothetical protein n=1 Tax=Timema californicum TaxID=61474 RepID=A0A7R9J1B4_TIMCA|nr:unnamed protein product [Timema californicum]